MVVDDEHFNLLAIVHNLKMALKLLRKDACDFIEDIIDEASFGKDAVDMFANNLTQIVRMFLFSWTARCRPWTGTLLLD